MKFVSVIIAAGGVGARTGLSIPKQFYRLGGKTVLERSVKPFDDSPLTGEIIVVAPADYIDLCRDVLINLKKPLKLVAGGKTRQQSVYNGLMAADKRCALAVVHDGARPFVSNSEIEGVINAADGCAAVVGTEVSETVKQVDSRCFVESTLQRTLLRAMQTPQAIPYNVFISAYKKAGETGFSATDDVSLAELVGYPVKVIEGNANNIKITCERDLLLAKIMLGL